ncbi:retrotransposon protein, putative, ty1-copia subclass, partial [Tanacetum coccineum]
EKKLTILDQHISLTPIVGATNEELADWNAIYDVHYEVTCLMFGSMTPELQRQFENYSPYDMLHDLKSMFEKQAGVESYVEQLEHLGYVLPQDINVGLIFNGRINNFSSFVKNYNMHNMGKTIGEIHALLIEYEKGLPKKATTPQVLTIQGENDDACHHCKEMGYWKRNYHVYIAELMKKKKQAGIISSLGERKLKQGVFFLYVGNGVHEQVEAIGSFDLVLSNGLVICLDNCHYAPTITRGVVSVSCLVDNGFIQHFTDYGISVSKNDVLYFNVIPRDGIYEIDMLNLVPNVNSIYNVSNKRAKHNLDSTYLWHYRLAHISKKRIEKLQHDGLLKSMDDESFNQGVPCLYGKITRKPFPHRTKKATDLLGHVSRQESATRILNMVPTKKVYKTPYELWYGKVPNLSHLKVWGCKALVKHDTHDKLQQRSVKCIFVGYPKEIIGYCFYFPPENKIFVARYAEFLEKNLISQEVSGKAIELEEIQDEDTSPSENTSEHLVEAKSFEPPQEDVAPVRSYRDSHSHAVFYDYEIWKMNVKTAFLNGYLDEDVYMVQPKGFIDPNHPRKVCKLQRSIFGLKQASKSWNKRFNEEIKKFGFAQNLDEPCVYQKASESNVTFLILYVDDIIIIGNHILMLQSVKSYLEKCFAMKDLGEAAFILGIKIYRDRSKCLIGLSQSAYMDKILKRFRMDNSKRGNISMQERLDLNKTQGASTPEKVKRMQNFPYASAMCSWFMVEILKLSLELLAIAMLDLRLIETTSKAEYIAALEAAIEAVWIRNFISGLGIIPIINEPIKMLRDNFVALLISIEPKVQKGARHYHRRYHYVHECIELGEINLLKAHTYDNLADPFMKTLPKGKLTQHARSIRLHLASSFCRSVLVF